MIQQDPKLWRNPITKVESKWWIGKIWSKPPKKEKVIPPKTKWSPIQSGWDGGVGIATQMLNIRNTKLAAIAAAKLPSTRSNPTRKAQSWAGSMAPMPTKISVDKAVRKSM